MDTNNRHQKLVEKALKRPGVKKAYDKLEAEFYLLTKLVQARQITGKIKTTEKIRSH